MRDCSMTGDGGLESLEGATTLFRSRPPTSTLFHDSPYIRALNRILSRERLAAHTYQRVAISRPAAKRFATLSDSHHHAAREVVRLITLNSGLPEDRIYSSLAPPIILIRLLNAVSPNLGQKATLQTLSLVEGRIARQYGRALKLAPERDRPILKDLQMKTLGHGESLKKRTF